MTQYSRFTLHSLTLLSAAFMTTAGFAKPAAPPKLTPDGDKAMAEYTAMLDRLRTGLKAKLPQIDKTQEAAFLATYEKEKGAMVTGKDKNGKPTQSLKGGNYSNPAASAASLEAAKPLLASIDRFLSSDSLDAHSAKCAVLFDATPQGLDDDFPHLLSVDGFRASFSRPLTMAHLAVEGFDGVLAIPAEGVADLVDHRASADAVPTRIALLTHDPGKCSHPGVILSSRIPRQKYFLTHRRQSRLFRHCFLTGRRFRGS